MSKKFARFDKTPGQDKVTVNLVDGLKVVIPNDLGQITPFVLLEQEDWFEDEIHFIRKFAEADTTMVDIGANFGIYTLAMAQASRAFDGGGKGRYWAIEPASNTANHLRDSVSANGFDNIDVLQLALSDSDGDGYLTLSHTSELNALADEAGDDTEQVKLSTLDSLAAEKFAGHKIDFLKIDAEGAESDILRGGAKFFDENSPLVMFELKHLSEVNKPLIQQFGEMGYNSYRNVPGLNVLVPFDFNDEVPGFMLNLFACKEDCAQELMARGLLLHPVDDKKPIDPAPWNEFVARQAWLKLANPVWENWGNGDLNTSEQILCDALCHWTAATRAADTPTNRNPHEEADYRYRQLKAARQRIESHPSIHDENSKDRIPYLLAYSRILLDDGEQEKALLMFQQVLRILSSGAVNLPAPFPAPSPRFDHVIDDFQFEHWLSTALGEAINDNQAFSNHFITPHTAVPILRQLVSSRYERAENSRRYLLLLIKSGVAIEGELPPVFHSLANGSDEHHNPELWKPHLNLKS